MGRPSKLTPECSAVILASLEQGATYADAAGAAGIDYHTLRNWITRGQAGRGKYFQFLHAVGVAEAKARLAFTKTIYVAAIETHDWRAAMEFLKRRDRATWGDSVDVTSGGASIVDNLWDLSKLSVAELASLEALAEKANAQQPATAP